MKKEKGMQQYFWAIMVLAVLVGGILGFTISNAVTTGQAMNLNACKIFTTNCMEQGKPNYEICRQKILGCMVSEEFEEWYIQNYGEKVKRDQTYEMIQKYDKFGVAIPSCDPGDCYTDKLGNAYYCRKSGTYDPDPNLSLIHI